MGAAGRFVVLGATVRGCDLSGGGWCRSDAAPRASAASDGPESAQRRSAQVLGLVCWEGGAQMQFDVLRGG